MQRHLGADPFQRLHLEVRIAHPVFDRAERMLNGFAPLAHLLWMLVKPLLDGLKNMLVLPAGNPAFLARGTLILDDAALTDIGPVAAQDQSVFLVCEMVDQALTGRANIDILISQIDKVLFSEPALGLDA